VGCGTSSWLTRVRPDRQCSGCVPTHSDLAVWLCQLFEYKRTDQPTGCRHRAGVVEILRLVRCWETN